MIDLYEKRTAVDKSGNGNFAILDIGTGDINLNPKLNSILLGYGFDGTFQTRSAIDLLHNPNLTFTASPSDKPRFLNYNPATTEPAKANKYVGK